MSAETFDLAGRTIRRVGFGAMQLPGPGVFGPPKDHDAAIAVLRRAVELGINHIDTSQFYGPDVANQLIREALFPYSDDLTLVTKLGARRDDQGAWLPAQHPRELKSALQQNLTTLELEQIPVANLRVMPREEMAAPELYCPLGEQLEAMRELVDAGDLGAFGVSNVSTEQARQAIDAGAVCVQNAYNLLSREDDPTLDLTAERGIAYVPFFPLGSAFPGMAKVTEDQRVKQVAERIGASPSQVGLAWLLARAENVLLIPGTSSLAHLEENTAAGEIALTADDLELLDAH